jgi:hypothetical protein
MNLSLPVHRLSIQIAIEGQEGQFSTNTGQDLFLHFILLPHFVRIKAHHLHHLKWEHGSFNCKCSAQQTIYYPHSGDFVQMFSTTQQLVICPSVHSFHCKNKGEVPAERPKIASTDQSSCSVLMLSTCSSALFPFPPSPFARSSLALL